LDEIHVFLTYSGFSFKAWQKSSSWSNPKQHAVLALSHNLPRRFIFPQPKPRMSQVTIRRPFGELDLCDEFGTDDDNSVCV
jgi:hypothetical protein